MMYVPEIIGFRADAVEERREDERPAEVADCEGEAVERHLVRAHAVELDEHQPVGEVDGVVQERLGDHQRGAENRPLRVRAEDEAQEHDVAVALLGSELERLRVVDGLELLARLSHGLLDLRELPLRLLHAAVGHEPARALGEGARHEDHDDREHGAHQEREPPADVRGERVQEDERGERAEDRAGPVAAVDPDVDAAPVLRGHHLVDRGVDRRVLAADSHARDEPRPVEPGEPDPAAVVDRERRKPGAEQVQEEGDDEQPLPPELIGHPSEDERADDLADEVDRRDQPDLGRGHVERVGLDEDARHRARDRDLQAVEDPGGAEPATMRVWNGDQLRRSSRAGTVLRIGLRAPRRRPSCPPLSVGYCCCQQLGDDDSGCGLHQRQVREGLREVAEVPARVGVELLRIEAERRSDPQEPLHQVAGLLQLADDREGGDEPERADRGTSPPCPTGRRRSRPCGTGGRTRSRSGRSRSRRRSRGGARRRRGGTRRSRRGAPTRRGRPWRSAGGARPGRRRRARGCPHGSRPRSPSRRPPCPGRRGSSASSDARSSATQHISFDDT